MVVLVVPAFADPALLDEIDRLVARVVASTVGAPVLLMTGRHIQVDRLARHHDPRRRDDDRLGINQRGRRDIANIDAPIYTRLVDADRDTDIRCREGGRRRADEQRDDGNFFHVFTPMRQGSGIYNVRGTWPADKYGPGYAPCGARVTVSHRLRCAEKTIPSRLASRRAGLRQASRGLPWRRWEQRRSLSAKTATRTQPGFDALLPDPRTFDRAAANASRNAGSVADVIGQQQHQPGVQRMALRGARGRDARRSAPRRSRRRCRG